MCIYSKGVKCKFHQLEQMCGKYLKYIIKCSNIQSRNFERAFNTTDTGGVHMKEEKTKSKKELIRIIESIEENSKIEYLLTYIRLILKRWG